MVPTKDQHVTKEKLQNYFHLPISEAAALLGICPTVMKNICRKEGIKRWPHRKIKSIDELIESISSLVEHGVSPDTFRVSLPTLREHRKTLIDNPDTEYRKLVPKYLTNCLKNQISQAQKSLILTVEQSPYDSSITKLENNNCVLSLNNNLPPIKKIQKHKREKSLLSVTSTGTANKRYFGDLLRISRTVQSIDHDSTTEAAATLACFEALAGNTIESKLTQISLEDLLNNFKYSRVSYPAKNLPSFPYVQF